jgi:hypothetical protein
VDGIPYSVSTWQLNKPSLPAGMMDNRWAWSLNPHSAPSRSSQGYAKAGHTPQERSKNVVKDGKRLFKCMAFLCRVLVPGTRWCKGR